MLPWFVAYISVILLLSLFSRHVYVEYYERLRRPLYEDLDPTVKPSTPEVYWWDSTLHNTRLQHEGRI